MSTSTSYKQLSIKYFREVFEIIDGVMKDHTIPYYLIGVNAIALELLKKDIKPSRGTKDIDFAIMLSEISQYDTIVESLEKQGFNKVAAPWTLYPPAYNVVIDLLPFGEIEQQYTTSFNERVTDLHVLGFKEILENPEQVEVEEIVINVPPIPGMVLLKLVAWSDRPEERDSDLSDILKIIQHYFQYDWDSIVKSHHDLFSTEPFDELKISARVLGRQAKKYLEKSEILENRISEVLKSNLSAIERSQIAIEWSRILDREVQYGFEILAEFQAGIKEGSK